MGRRGLPTPPLARFVSLDVSLRPFLPSAVKGRVSEWACGDTWIASDAEAAAHRQRVEQHRAK
eukprot:1939625-Pyramimonas_sp.AAC.1